jgi:DNA repair protein RadA/Sms
MRDLKGQREGARPTGVAELDRVLGGGLVAGQAVLLGGEPGIGKSTLLLQALGTMARSGVRCLYVCAEESAEQVRIRADRLGLGDADVNLLPETGAEDVLAVLEESAFEAAVVDSIQMMHLADVPSAPGSVSQVRECALALTAWAKRKGAAVFLVGHVTKDGSIAGPRVLEHVVDTVLYFEGERFQSFRLLRSVKNRFGPTLELGVFEMRQEGLVGVTDASRLFLGPAGSDAPGGAVVPCLEGRRPLLVEIQGLAAPSAYGTAVRRATGVDPNRMPMVLAVLEKRGGIPLAGRDVFVNAVGGVRVSEPAADLGMALAVASSVLDKAVPAGWVVAGEIGLRGEIRPVSREDVRLAEAEKLGFTAALFPSGSFPMGKPPSSRIRIVEISTIGEALAFLRA